ncbi:hypothetical protein DPMN_035689 [Dreissena polymorpha]|uniref:monoamine oxidase n=1 Tax=Dreissena polymorpha TaxID=45954 RepID=A0A9D4RM81_DREPO|nr:hypothetical protein DPMN_035689 [Dreissena polymorpha]
MYPYNAGGGAIPGNIRNLIEATENTAQEYKIKWISWWPLIKEELFEHSSDATHITIQLMERIGKEKVRLGEPVASVQQSGNVVTVTTKTGHTYTCHKLILAIPPMQMTSPNLVRSQDWPCQVVSNGGPTTCLGCEMGPWQKQSSRRSAVLKSLAEFFGDEVYAYLDFQEKIWDIEPFNEGAPVSIVGPGAMRHYAPGLRESFDR